MVASTSGSLLPNARRSNIRIVLVRSGSLTKPTSPRTSTPKLPRNECTRPTAVAELSASDASVAAADASTFAVRLDWRASSDDVQVQGYNVYRNGALLVFVLCVWAVLQLVVDDLRGAGVDRVGLVALPMLAVALIVVFVFQDRGLWRFEIQLTSVLAGLGGVAALVGEERRDLTVLGHLGATAGTGREVGLDRGALVGVDRVEGVGPEEVDDLVVGHVPLVHGWPPTPASASPVRRRRSPERILVFTVPSGSSSIDATSR